MIPFLPTRYIVIALAILITASGTHLATKRYYNAIHTAAISKLVSEHKSATEKTREAHATELNALNKQIATVQDELTNKTRELNHALRTKTTHITTAIDTGTIRLRDKHAKQDTCTNTSPKGNNTSNPSANVRQPDNGSGTGRELSRQTSQALVQLATDAEKTNIALKACIAQYNNIRGQLEDGKSSD